MPQRAGNAWYSIYPILVYRERWGSMRIRALEGGSQVEASQHKSGRVRVGGVCALIIPARSNRRRRKGKGGYIEDDASAIGYLIKVGKLFWKRVFGWRLDWGNHPTICTDFEIWGIFYEEVLVIITLLLHLETVRVYHDTRFSDLLVTRVIPRR